MLQYAKDYIAKGSTSVQPLGKTFRDIVGTRNRKNWWTQASVVINKYIGSQTKTDNISPKPFRLDRSYHSGYFEKLAEHLFLADLLKHSIKAQKPLIEISKPEADIFGYDLVLTCNRVIRHIQVKSSTSTGKVQYHKIHENLKNYPSACVVWIVIDEKFDLEYRFFGNTPGEPIPDLSEFHYAQHTKGNANGEKALRKNIRKIPKSKFEKLADIKELETKLFGK